MQFYDAFSPIASGSNELMLLHQIANFWAKS